MDVLLPIPSTDFDPTETAIPWAGLTKAGVRVSFATPDGQPGRADHRMVEGEGLGPWKSILRANRAAREAYREMSQSEAFRHPTSWDSLDPDAFDGLLLPGGHARGMREYLESSRLQDVVAAFMQRDAPVGAICHGVVLLARSRRADGTSVIAGRRVTALLQSQELTAYQMTRWWLGRYYRTYDQTVEAEVRKAVGADGSFETGPFALLRDTPDHLGRGFTVCDRNLVTARWPGDAFRFTADFLALLGDSAAGT